MNYSFLLVDDHDFILHGVENLLHQHYPNSTITKAKSAEMAMEILSNKIDILISDVSLPGQSGIELAEITQKSYPGIKIVSLTQHTELWIIKQLIKANVNAIVLKKNEQGDIIKAIKAVISGENFYTNEVQKIIISDISKKSITTNTILPTLTLREKEILKLIADELTTNEIAEQLFLSAKTVEVHRKNLFLKLEVKNAAGMVRKAFELGLL